MAIDTRFPNWMRLRVPAGMNAAVKAAARQQHQGSTEWCRQVILAGLERQGLHLTPDGQVEQREPAGRAR
jgi:hypothetical protein